MSKYSHTIRDKNRRVKTIVRDENPVHPDDRTEPFPWGPVLFVTGLCICGTGGGIGGAVFYLWATSPLWSK